MEFGHFAKTKSYLRNHIQMKNKCFNFLTDDENVKKNKQKNNNYSFPGFNGLGGNGIKYKLQTKSITSDHHFIFF